MLIPKVIYIVGTDVDGYDIEYCFVCPKDNSLENAVPLEVLFDQVSVEYTGDVDEDCQALANHLSKKVVYVELDARSKAELDRTEYEPEEAELDAWSGMSNFEVADQDTGPEQEVDLEEATGLFHELEIPVRRKIEADLDSDAMPESLVYLPRTRFPDESHTLGPNLTWILFILALGLLAYLVTACSNNLWPF